MTRAFPEAALGIPEAALGIPVARATRGLTAPEARAFICHQWAEYRRVQEVARSHETLAPLVALYRDKVRAAVKTFQGRALTPCEARA